MAVIEQKTDGLRFGQMLQAARRSAGWSQKALADELGVDPSTISSWENGHTEPQLFQWRRIVVLLDLDYMADVRELPLRCITTRALSNA